MEHASTKHMTCIISRNFDVTQLQSLMQLNSLNLIDTILDHFRAETINFAFLSDRNLSEILQHQWNNSLGWWSSDDGPTVTYCFAEIGQCTTMVEVKVRY